MYLKTLPENFGKPTFELGYFLGVMMGDGSFGYYGGKEKSNYAINLQTVSEEFADLFRENLSELTGFKVWKSAFERKTGSYRRKTFNIMAQSKVLHDYLLLNLKSGIPKICYENEECLKGFVSGFFDSDGCLIHDRKYFYADFANNNIRILNDLRELFIKRGFHPTNICERQISSNTFVKQNKPVYRFKLGRQREVKILGVEWLRGFKK